MKINGKVYMAVVSAALGKETWSLEKAQEKESKVAQKL